MLGELRAANSDLNIEILGVNQNTDGAFNAAFTEGRVLPWLQDTVGESVWARWKVTYRDVRILDAQNRLFATFNLTEHDLGNPTNRATLKELFLTAAKVVDSDLDGLPDDWEIHYFGDIAVGPAGDQDNDGMDNLREFVLGTDPTKLTAIAPLTVVRPRNGSTAGPFSFSFRRQAGGLFQYQIETSLDLRQWLPANPVEWKISPARNRYDGTGTSDVACSRAPSAALNPCEFVRIHATRRQQP